LTVADVRDKIDYTITNDDDYTLVTVSVPRTEVESDETEADVEETNTEEE